MVFRQFLERIVTQHITRDILRRLGFIERNTREMVIFIIIVIGAESHVLRRYLSYHARGHNVVRMNRIEPHEVGEDLVLILIHHSFFFAYVHHRQHFFARYRRIIFVIGEHTRDQLNQQHERIQHINKQTYRAGGETHQLAPIGSTDNLRDDLRENENKDGREGRHEAEPFRTEDSRHLHTHTGCTDGISDRVQRQNSSQRTTGIVLVFTHQLGRRIALLLTQIDITQRRRHQHRFQHGTQKTDAHCAE